VEKEKEYSIFADESGTHDEMKCYTIGSLVVPNDRLTGFESWFNSQKKKHGVTSELKWTGIRNSHGTINFVLDLFKALIRAKFQLGFIVVWKKHYVKWQSNKENAFYGTYTQLMHHLIRASDYPHSVFIDDRSDSYKKQDEAMQIIVNNMLGQIKAASKLKTVKKSDSKLMAGIQAVDLLTGAINSSHNSFLDNNYKVNIGKRVLIERLAKIIGWDDLCYDTFPKENPNPNIWHFPHKEFRKVPDSRNIKTNFRVPYIKPEEVSGK
jgi:hypothetical protein